MATAEQGERFLTFRGDKNLNDLEKAILALPDSDPDKEVFYDYFTNEFYDVNTIGTLKYDMRYPVLSDEAQGMFDRIYYHRKNRSYFAEAFKAMLDHDEKRCLKYLEKHLVSEENKGNLVALLNESDFCAFFLDPFKNSFKGFYKKARGILNKIKTEDQVKMLCEHMDEYYSSDDPDQMAAAMYPVVQKYPDSIVANMLLGYAHYEAKRWGNAIACFEKAEDPQFLGVFWLEDIYFFKAWAYSKLKEHKNAAAYYEKIIEDGINDEYSLNNLGYEYYLMKQYQKALKTFERCLKENRGVKYAANNYVRTLLAMGRVNEAKAFINEEKYKVITAIVRRVKSASGKKEPVKEAEIPDDDATLDIAEEKGVRKVAGGQQFSSEKLLEDELSMRIDAGIPVFGLKLKIYRRHGEYGRQYIIPIGRLDLLAEDPEGNLYIIELKKDSGYDDPYKQTAEYIDWFEKNHKSKKNIFGIICLNNPTEKVIKAVKKDPRIRLFNYAISYNEII